MQTTITRNLGDYASVTAEQKQAIIEKYWEARALTNDIGQAVAIAAMHGLRLSVRQWNGKTGTRAFATALAVLYMAGKLKLSDSGGAASS